MTTCIIAEDEALFRDALVSTLKETWPSLDILAACEDGAEALELISDKQPDVVFLDIRMPGLTGLEVARAMAQCAPQTQIVFVTAYDQYAISAFEQGAVDYLQKPISRERVERTVARLQSRLHSNSAAQKPIKQASPPDLAALITQLQTHLTIAPTKPPLVWITASAGRETRLIMMDDVLYFQADSKYTVVMTADGEALVRKPLRELLVELDATHFKQIHRSTIVNLRAIASITRDDTGKGLVKLKARSETLIISQAFMPLFKAI
jgi:DNA-binding LytR/AlgR family response regulator